MMSNDPEGEPTDPLFDLILQKFEPEFDAMANLLAIPDEELERVAAEFEGKFGLGTVFAYFLRHVKHTRYLTALASYMRPGEEGVTIPELQARMSRKGDA